MIFFPLCCFNVWKGRAEHSCSDPGFYQPLLHHSSPHGASRWPIFGSPSRWWAKWLRGQASPVRCRSCFSFLLIREIRNSRLFRIRPTLRSDMTSTILPALRCPAISDALTSFSAPLLGCRSDDFIQASLYSFCSLRGVHSPWRR